MKNELFNFQQFLIELLYVILKPNFDEILAEIRISPIFLENDEICR